MNVPDLLDKLGVSYRRGGETPHVTRGWVGVVCPFCGSGTGNYGMGINLSHLNCSCWKCGPCRLIDLLHAATDVPKSQLFPLFKDLDKSADFGKIKVRGKLTLPKDLGPLRKAHRQYLRSRGFDPKVLVRLWGIGGIGPFGGRGMAWRVFIPIHYRGEIVSWTTRAISDKVSKRYFSAKPEQERISHKTLLYGEDYCRNSVIVVEGPTDVWRIGPGAVCTFGTGIRPAQLKRVAEFPTRAVCFDKDRIAQGRAEEVVSVLEVFDGDTFKVTIPEADPGSASPQTARRLRERFLEAPISTATGRSGVSRGFLRPGKDRSSESV